MPSRSSGRRRMIVFDICTGLGQLDCSRTHFVRIGEQSASFSSTGPLVCGVRFFEFGRTKLVVPGDHSAFIDLEPKLPDCEASISRRVGRSATVASFPGSSSLTLKEDSVIERVAQRGDEPVEISISRRDQSVWCRPVISTSVPDSGGLELSSRGCHAASTASPSPR